MVTPVAAPPPSAGTLVAQAAGDALAGLIGGKKASRAGTSSVASGLVRTSMAGSRPAFELQFNALQNAWITRINKKIEEYNAIKQETNLTVDLDIKRQRLLSDADEIGAYVDRQGSNRGYLTDISDQLTLLSVELDPTQFAAIRDDIKYRVDLLKTTFLDQFGIADGLQGLKNKFANGFTVTGAPNTSGDFETLTVGTLSSSQIVEIKNQVESKLYLVQTNRDTSLAQQDNITDQLADVDASISKVKEDLLSAKMNEVNEMRQKAAAILNIISLNFEVANGQQSQFAQGAIYGQSNGRGSVMNLFS